MRSGGKGSWPPNFNVKFENAGCEASELVDLDRGGRGRNRKKSRGDLCTGQQGVVTAAVWEGGIGRGAGCGTSIAL